MQALLISALALAAQPDFEFSGAVPADGYLGAVTVPELPVGATEETHDLRYSFSIDADVEGGGQNRSTKTHPGLPPLSNGAMMWLVTRQADDGPPPEDQPIADAVLPWLSTSRTFKDWGPTTGSPTGPWPEVEEWAPLFERGEPSIYWGPGSPEPPGPFTYGSVIEDDWTVSYDIGPGDDLQVWLPHEWEMPDWPADSHLWPTALRVRARVTLDLGWVPAG